MTAFKHWFVAIAAPAGMADAAAPFVRPGRRAMAAGGWRRGAGAPGLWAKRVLSATLLLASVSLAFCAEPPGQAIDKAKALFDAGKWGEAGNVLEEYARRRPAPPRLAEALVLQGRCHERRGDFAAAQKIYRRVAHDDAMLRKDPDAVAMACDRLHALLVSQGAPATTRKRLIEEARLRVRSPDAQTRIREREGAALVAADDIRGALASYRAAPTLSEPGRAALSLLEAVAAPARKVADADIESLSKLAVSKPDLVRPLCRALSRCRDGWRAEDFLATHCLACGRGREAAEIWKDLSRRKVGPVDAIAYSYCEALAEFDASAAMRELDRWLAAHPLSPLEEKAHLARARLESAHGDLGRAIALFEEFLGKYPHGRYSDVAGRELAEARKAASLLEAQRAREEERAEAMEKDPLLAKVEAGEALLRQRRYKEAARLFNSLKAIAGQGLRGRVLLGLGEALRGQGDFRGALGALGAASRTVSATTNALSAARAHRAMGDILLEDTGEYGKAISAYEKCLALQPDIADSGFWMNYGIALMVSGRGEDAARIFEGRRGKARDDLAVFAKWDNLVKMCAQGREERGRTLLQERKAFADIQVAEALLEGGAEARALKLFKGAAGAAVKAGLGDRCALGTAQCLAAAGKARDALAAYAEFGRKFAGSPLAPRALLQAGVLCASPGMDDFREARKHFDAVVAKYPKAPEATAAEFYSATLAWRGRKWDEAEKLHRAFAERHPDSPLARVALEERLPAIAAKSLATPAMASRQLPVIVSPYDRLRMSCAIMDFGVSCDALLEIHPEKGWKLVSSQIMSADSRRQARLWQVMRKSSIEHTYYLCDAFSSQEFVMVDGGLVPNEDGKGHNNWPFRVTVPSVDVDWAGFGSAGDEVGEESRSAIVPLNTNGVGDVRQVLLKSPFDDDGRHHRLTFGSPVSPSITLKQSPANRVLLLRDGETAIPDEWTVDASGEYWPISFDVMPLGGLGGFTIYCEGQRDDYGGKAKDYIYGRIVDVDLDVDANYDGVINGSDEPLEETQGGIVGVHTGNLARIELKIEPSNLPGKARLSATNGSKIKVWTNPGRTQKVSLPKTWDNVSTMPSQLYVEGVSPSAGMRDIELKLEYDENVDGENRDIFKCSDKVKLTAVKLDVRKIWFNYKQDSANADALNIKMSYNENVSLPEYVKDTTNCPAAYVRNTIAKIKVSFSISPSSISSARIYGLSDDDNGSLGDALEKQVAFASGVSQSTLPTGENSEFVEFELSGQTPSTVFKSVDSWTWGFSEVDGLNVSSLGLVGDQTFGHVIYTLWDYPKAPWNQTVGDSHNPWVNALSFAIETAGCTNKNDFGSMEAITQYLHSGHGLTYDTYEGAPRYAYNHLGGGMSLSSYMVKGNSAIVNCYDQASGVVSLGRLLGIGAIYKYKEPFGYINTVNLVGIGLCNNPFFESNGTTPIVGSDWLEPLRKHFGNHAFVSYDDKIFDACVGPCLGDWTLTQYLYNAIDTSTTPELEAATPRYSIVIGAITDVW